jgi:hypothetical protein
MEVNLGGYQTMEEAVNVRERAVIAAESLTEEQLVKMTKREFRTFIRLEAWDGQRTPQRTNTSEHVGIRQVSSGRWRVVCTAAYASIYLGTFDTLEEAASARQQAEAKIKRLGEDALKAMTPDRRKFIIRGW